MPTIYLYSMDFLKAEIAGKRKALDETTARPNKYMRKGDIEKLKEEEMRKQKEEKERAEKEERRQNVEDATVQCFRSC